VKAAVSIIIPTRDRVAQLARMLQSVERAVTVGSVSAEVVLIDNGSRDGTGALLDQWVRADRGRKQLFVAQPGKSRALNQALAVAGAPLLAFIDDDVEVTPHWLQAIINFFTSHPWYDAAMGRVLLPPAARNDHELQARLAAYRTVPLMDKGEGVCDAEEMYGCNMMIRRSVFERIGGFNEQLGPPDSSNEDLDMAHRISRAGMRIGYIPQAIVYHEVDRARLTEEYHRRFQVRLARGRVDMDGGRRRWRSVPRLVEAAFGYFLWSLLQSPIRQTHARGRMIRHLAVLRYRRPGATP